MARQKGSANLAATIEVLAGGALDARTTVPTEADLIVANNFPYPYVGLFTVVQATGEMWVLKNMDVTNIENWHKVGSGGADNVVEGYYNETDGKFYEESTYTTEIVGEDKILYISLDTNLLYRFDGTDFVVLSAQGQTVQVDTLPTASADELGKIYQYVGANATGRVNGMFYQCVTDGSTYSWVAKKVSASETVSLTQAQFNALSQAEKDNGTSYYITDSSALTGVSVMGNRFDKANIYTDTEKMIGSYMGKPLYQKTFGATVSSEYSLVSGVFMRGSYSLLDANLDIEDMPFADGFYTDATNNETESFIDVWYNTTDSKLYFITYLDRENVAAEFTIRYTKVNDGTVAIGTGTDYSTDEQIIGTWIDGKRLYQKTLTFDPTVTIPENTWTDLADISSLNVDKLIFASAHGGNGQENPSIINVDNNKLRGFNYKGSIGLIEAIIIQYTKTTD